MDSVLNDRPATKRPTLERALPSIGFAAVAMLWATFGAAIVVESDALVALWARIQGLWLPFRAIAWSVFFPWLLGLRIWEANWAPWVRVGAVIALAIATFAATYPPRHGVRAPRDPRGATRRGPAPIRTK